MRDVYIIGAGMTPFGKHMDKNMKTLAAVAVNASLQHAVLTKEAIQTAVVGNAYQGIVTGQESIRGQVVLRAMGIGDIPVTNVENACCSSATALQVVWMDVALGLHDVGLVLGMEKMYMDDREKRLKLYSSSADVEVVEVLLDDLVAAQPQVGVPIAVLPFEVAPALLAAVGVLDYRAADPIGVQRHHIAQFAAVHLGDHVEVERIAAPLRAADHGQFLLLRLFGGGNEEIGRRFRNDFGPDARRRATAGRSAARTRRPRAAAGGARTAASAAAPGSTWTPTAGCSSPMR